MACMCERARALVQASCACVLMAAVLPLTHWRTERNFAASSPENRVQPTNETGTHVDTVMQRTRKQAGGKTGRGAAGAAVHATRRSRADRVGLAWMRSARLSWGAEEPELLQNLVLRCSRPPLEGVRDQVEQSQRSRGSRTTSKPRSWLRSLHQVMLLKRSSMQQACS